MTEYNADGQQKREMTEQDRSLCKTYWKLQGQAHTHPGIRLYLTALSKTLRDRGIMPRDVNDFGLEMERREYTAE